MIMIMYNDKIREVEDLRVVFYDLVNLSGDVESCEYVEFMVKGNNHDWKMAVPIDEFIKDNPDVRLE